jgi:hypothetical protein
MAAAYGVALLFGNPCSLIASVLVHTAKDGCQSQVALPRRHFIQKSTRFFSSSSGNPSLMNGISMSSLLSVAFSMNWGALPF